MNSSMPAETSSNNVLTKPMIVGGSHMKHGNTLKALLIGLFVIIIVVATAVISYGVGYMVATEDAIAQYKNAITSTPDDQTMLNDGQDLPASFPAASYAQY